MSSKPQLSPAVVHKSRLFEPDPPVSTYPERTVAVSCPNVLLVGRNGSWGAAVLRSLDKFESDLSFAPPQNVTSESVRNGRFNLVLLDSTVSPEQRKRLAAELVGSGASMFYTFPVENGCWWLPTLRNGQDVHGCCAFRRNEFPAELERMLQAGFE
jgi:hypothetical protein